MTEKTRRPLTRTRANQVKNALTFNDFRGDNTNSGQIFAISHNGDATVLRSFYQPTITNSGLLAAQAFNGWSARTIDFENGGHLINQVRRPDPRRGLFCNGHLLRRLGDDRECGADRSGFDVDRQFGLT